MDVSRYVACAIINEEFDLFDEDKSNIDDVKDLNRYLLPSSICFCQQRIHFTRHYLLGGSTHLS